MKNPFKIVFSLYLISSIQIFAQNEADKSDDAARIALHVFIPDKVLNTIPPMAKSVLENKLGQMATKNGLSGSGNDPRFFITANVVMLSKDVTPTAPPMVAVQAEATFYIADALTKTKFASASVQLKGVGNNDTKAFLEAIKQINPNASNLQMFIAQGKTKILEYYNSQCDFILKDAQSLADQNKYEEALWKLSSVPDVCKGCYDKAKDAIGPLYKKFMEKNCESKLMQARAKFYGNPTSQGATDAAMELSWIDTDAKCFPQAQALVDSIKVRIEKNENKQWDYMFRTLDKSAEANTAIVNFIKESSSFSYKSSADRQAQDLNKQSWLF